MVVGVVLLQLVTGNQLVRLVLGSVGAVKPAGEPQPSDQAQGRPAARPDGTAADSRPWARRTARARLRPWSPPRASSGFPEINAQKARDNGDIGIDDVTEYFLVGSFASWILALGGLVLAQ